MGNEGEWVPNIELAHAPGTRQRNKVHVVQGSSKTLVSDLGRNCTPVRLAWETPSAPSNNKIHSAIPPGSEVCGLG
jgi:hypothetical protein